MQITDGVSKVIKEVTSALSIGLMKIYENPDRIIMAARRKKIFIRPSARDMFEETLSDMIQELDRIHNNPIDISQATPEVAFGIMGCLFEQFIPEGTEQNPEKNDYYKVARELQVLIDFKP